MIHQHFLQNNLLSDVLAGNTRPLVFVRPDTSIRDCLNVFREYNIHSAPVFDATHNEFIGTVDQSSILSFLLPAEEDLTSSSLQEREMIPCSRILKQQICLMEPTESIWNFLHLDASKHCSRTLVHFPKQFHLQLPYSVISEFDILKFLAKNVDKLGPIGHQSIEELHIWEPSRRNMVLVKASDQALKGYLAMLQANARIAGIVDDEGKLIGTLSISDFAVPSSKISDRLLLPINKFLHFAFPVSCFQTDTLGLGIIKAAGAQVHQLWIIDSAERPLGVIFLSDMLDVLVKEPHTKPLLNPEQLQPQQAQLIHA